MKAQKQLPKEFTFICDEHSKEQLEKLGVKLNGYKITEEDYSDYYIVIDKKIISMAYSYELINEDSKLINLSDYIEQQQPEPKQLKTK